MSAELKRYDPNPHLVAPSTEQQRIDFVISRDGMLPAIAWAERTAAIYQAGLEGNSSGTAWMRSPEYRYKFQASIDALKAWLNQQSKSLF